MSRHILLLTLFFGLTACQTQESDRSFLVDRSCSPPCWQNIIPGVTSQEESVGILSNSPLIQHDTLSCYTSQSKEGYEWCSFRRTSEEGSAIGFQNRTVNGFQLQSRNLTLDEVVSALGEPEYITNLHGSQTVEEGKCYRFDAYYLRGISLLVSNCEPIDSSITTVSGNSLVVFPSMTVLQLVFIQPADDLQVLMEHKYNVEELSDYYMVDLNSAHKWSGYGLYPLPSDQ